jgi:hypothetical protein
MICPFWGFYMSEILHLNNMWSAIPIIWNHLESRMKTSSKELGLEGMVFILLIYWIYTWMVYLKSTSSLQTLGVECPFHQLRGVSAWGADIYEAAEQGNVCAVRHFLHLDPGSLQRKDQGDGRSLRTEVGTWMKVIRAVHAWYTLVQESKSDGPRCVWPCGITSLLLRHPKFIRKLSFCYPWFGCGPYNK